MSPMRDGRRTNKQTNKQTTRKDSATQPLDAGRLRFAKKTHKFPKLSLHTCSPSSSLHVISPAGRPPSEMQVSSSSSPSSTSSSTSVLPSSPPKPWWAIWGWPGGIRTVSLAGADLIDVDSLPDPTLLKRPCHQQNFDND